MVNLTYRLRFLLLAKTRFVELSWVFPKEYLSLWLFYKVFDVIKWILALNCHLTHKDPARFDDDQKQSILG